MKTHSTLQRQRGAGVVEFSLALLIFLTFLLGITDFAHMLFTWNAANEATRAGARFAVVCDNTTFSADVLGKMQALLPQINTIDVAWDPPGCTTTDCQGVRVSITNLDYQWISPIVGRVAAAIPMPAFATYLPREVMRQDPNSVQMCNG